jgi:hypothetical protein
LDWQADSNFKMKVFTKIVAVLLLLIFLVSTLATSVLAANSISLISKWTDNNSTQLSVYRGDDAEAFVYVHSTSNFKLWIDVYDDGTKVKSVVNGMVVPANTQTTYSHNFKINTDDLGAIGGKDYKVRVHVMNINTAESENKWLDLKVTRRLIYVPWDPWIPTPTPNNVPVMDAVPNKEVFEGTELQFNVMAGDADEESLTYETEVCSVYYYGCLNYSSVESVGASLEDKTVYGDEFFGEFTWTPDYDLITHPTVGQNKIFRFRAYDGKSYSTWEYTNILVKDVNRIPYFELVGDQFVNEGQELEISLKGHDLDNDELTYAYTGSQLPGASIVKTNKSDGKFTWTPDLNGADNSPYMIKITVYDGFGGQRSEDIKITVANTSLPPVAQDAKVQTDEDTPIGIDLSLTCIDPDNQVLTYSLDSQASNGYVSLFGHKANYNPATNFNGVDSFTYSCRDVDGNVSNTATVKIIVNPVNDDPVAVNDYITIYSNNNIEIDVLVNDYDVDGDSLSIVDIHGPQFGTTNINGNKIEYTANPNFISGLDDFKYRISDGNGGYDWALVKIKKILELPQCHDEADNDGDGLTDYPNDPGCDSKDDDDENDDPNENHAPVANDDFTATHYGKTIFIDVLANDYDSDGDTLLVTENSEPNAGTLEWENGVFKYTATENPFLGEIFYYVIIDGNGGYDEAKVTIAVLEQEDPQCSDGLDNDEDGLTDYPNDPGCENGEDDDEYNETNNENHAPVAKNDKATTYKEEAVYIDVLANDTDEDGDNLTIISLTPPMNGGIDIVNGQVYYIPEPEFVGLDTFTYTISDGNGGTDTAMIMVNVIKKEGPLPQCSDGLDNDNDGLVDYPEDPGCENPKDDDEFNHVVEEEPEVPYTNVKFGSIKFSEETYNPGDLALIRVNMKNNGDEDLQNLKLTSTIYMFGEKGTSGKFNLDAGENTSRNVYVKIPYYAQPGKYLVKLTVSNSHYHDSSYRQITVN